MTDYYITLIVALVGASGAATEFIKRIIKTDTKWVNAVLSWVIPFLVAYGAWIIGYLPPITQPDWLWIGIEGFLVGIACHWSYGLDVVRKILDFVFSWINGEKWYVKEK